MEFEAIGKTLSEKLPSIKTRIQLSGLIIIVVVGALVAFARPGDYIALILVGGIGVSFIVFGQIFHFLTSFRNESRPTVFLVSFISFLFFIVILALIFVMHVQPSPSLLINQAQAEEPKRNKEEDHLDPLKFLGLRKPIVAMPNTPPDVGNTLVVSNSDGVDSDVGTQLKLPEAKSATDIEYKFTTPKDVPTLSAEFPYSTWSRSDEYPDADFHQAVSFGYPFMSFNIANPTDAILFYTLLKVDLIAMKPIKDVILDIGEIDNYISGKKQYMKINNRGWGIARNAKLKLMVAKPIASGKYLIIASKIYAIAELDGRADVEIGDLVPPEANWEASGNPPSPASGCVANGHLFVIGRLDYTDDNDEPKHETFRSTIYQCFGGGGGIPWSAMYNLNLPTDPGKFPVVLSLHECIGARSAGRFRVQYVAEKSAHYRLRFSLEDTNKSVITEEAELDILVPRPWRRADKPEAFIENLDVKGCS
jgi:hypothetical protein